MPTQVYITVDTESSMGGAWQWPERQPLPASRHIFCRNDEGSWGIPLIVNELKKHGMAATFFCEMLATPVLGEEDTRSVTDYLLEKGQDVQLHAHPTYHHYHRYLQGNGSQGALKDFYKCDLLSRHDAAKQTEMLEEACAHFKQITGRSPFAFRAGCFSASRATLRILRSLGMDVDSSFDPCYQQASGSFPKGAPGINQVQKMEGMWEFPITVARTRSLKGPAYKHFNISAISVPEMEQILNSAHDQGMEHVVVLFHSFSTVKAKDTTYSTFKPDRIVINRLKKFLNYLGSNDDRFEVRTLGGLEGNLDGLRETPKEVIPDLGLWRPMVRKSVQGLNRFYWL